MVSLLLLVFYNEAHYDPFSVEPYIAIWPHRLVVMLALIGVCIWKSVRWPVNPTRVGVINERAQTTDCVSIRKTALQSLCWQACRQNFWAIIAYFGGMIVASLLLSVFSTDPGRFKILPNIVFPSLVLSPLLLGTFTFAGDHFRDRYKFHTQQGECPARMWLSRIAVGATCVVVASLLAGILMYRFNTTDLETLSNGAFVGLSIYHKLGWAYLLFAIGAYSIGACCSLCVRSPLLSVVLSIVLAAPLVVWVYAMTLANVPLWWSVLPIPFVFFAASLFCVKDWLLDNSRWSKWVLPVVIVLIPCAGIFFGMTQYRIHEIPEAKYSLPTPTPEDRRVHEEFGEKFAAVYKSYEALGSNLYESDAESFAWLEPKSDGGLQLSHRFDRQVLQQYVLNNQEFIQKLALLLDESNEDFKSIRIVLKRVIKDSPHGRVGSAEFTIDLLNLNAVYWLVVEPDAEKAFEAIWTSIVFGRFADPLTYELSEHQFQYLNIWLNLPGQTPQSLDDAFRRLWEYKTKIARSPSDVITYLYWINKSTYDAAAFESYYRGSRKLNSQSRFMSMLPWEQERFDRFRDCQINQLLQTDWERMVNRDVLFTIERKIDTSLSVKKMFASTTLAGNRGSITAPARQQFSWLIRAENSLNCFLFAIALAKHGIEQGQYPESLLFKEIDQSESIEDWAKMLVDNFPVDADFQEIVNMVNDKLSNGPTAFRQFAYFPTGVQHKVFDMEWDKGERKIRQIVPENRAFLCDRDSIEFMAGVDFHNSETFLRDRDNRIFLLPEIESEQNQE